MYPTHNPDGTCTKEYFQAIRALNCIRDTGYAWMIDPDWTPEFERVWMLHVRKLAWERGFIAIADGRTLKLIPKEDSNASATNR